MIYCILNTKLMQLDTIVIFRTIETAEEYIRICKNKSDLKVVKIDYWYN